MRYFVAVIACFLVLFVCTSVLRELIVPFSFKTPGFLIGSIITGALITMTWRLITLSGKKTVNQTVPNPDNLMAQDMPSVVVEKGLSTMNNDAFYDEVAKEMQENRLVPGVWTRAFAEADGDENRAKAIYIKLRVAKLLDQHREQVDQEKHIAEQKRRAQEEILVARKRLEEGKRLAEEEKLKGKSELFKQWYKSQKETGSV
jgi:hypothetical protein